MNNNQNIDKKQKLNTADQAKSAKAEIRIKENPKAAALKKAPDEVLAKAIREALLKDKG